MEEPRQDLVTVLGREDLRELDDARHAKPPVAQRVDDLRESLDEPRGSLPVERRPAREPELPVQEVKSEACPSSTHSRFRSKSARATRNSASAARSRWRSSARRAERSRAEVMTGASHAISGPPQTYGLASGSANASRHSRTPLPAFGAREARAAAPGAAFPHAPSPRSSSGSELRQARRPGRRPGNWGASSNEKLVGTASRSRHWRFLFADAPRPPHSSLPEPGDLRLVPSRIRTLRRASLRRDVTNHEREAGERAGERGLDCRLPPAGDVASRSDNPHGA